MYIYTHIYTYSARSILTLSICKKLQMEGLKSQNHCIRSLRNALRKFKSQEATSQDFKVNFPI